MSIRPRGGSCGPSRDCQAVGTQTGPEPDAYAKSRQRVPLLTNISLNRQIGHGDETFSCSRVSSVGRKRHVSVQASPFRLLLGFGLKRKSPAAFSVRDITRPDNSGPAILLATTVDSGGRDQQHDVGWHRVADP